ncbi:MAG: argininosuccinate lyase [Actinomycetota bacterium]
MTDQGPPGERPLWGGRFGRGPADALLAFSVSLRYDRRLWPQELQVTAAHARALERAGLLDGVERASIEEALEEARKLFEEEAFPFDSADEDIHSAVERFLIARLGETGRKIHAGRSRNDLVATDLRLWVKEAARQIARGVHELEEALYRQAREHQEVLAPGYTHLQRAQPVLLPHLLLAHAFALSRDFERIIAVYRRADVSALGAAAFAGTTLPLDAPATARDLGFARTFDNAADAVSDRDFVLELLAAGAILGVHLSRLAEEIVLWTSQEFGFATLDDAWATGSSIMPQKRNADVAELTRAKAARLTANLVHLLGVMKGLPLTYNRDLQEDKEPAFDTADTLVNALTALRGALLTMRFHPDRLEAAAGGGFTTATDVAEALVLKGMPFREAHEVVGRLVGAAAAAGKDLAALGAEELAVVDARVSTELVASADVRRSVGARRSHGGTAPSRIAEQLARIEAVMDDQERWLSGFGAY